MAGSKVPEERLAMIKELVKKAKEMTEKSYAPYSGFKVGAALLASDGRIFTGCNIENSAYSPSICAERTAFAKAVSEGAREFKAICIAGGQDGLITERCYPCGVCRQVMSEFCDPDEFEIILPDSSDLVEIFALRELLPKGFTLN